MKNFGKEKVEKMKISCTNETCSQRSRNAGIKTRCPHERKKRRTVLLHGLMEHRHRPGHDVVAAQRHRPGPGVSAEPLHEWRVARQRPVLRAAEALRPQLPAQAPRPPPRPLQRSQGAPRQDRARQQRLPRQSRHLRLAGAEQSHHAVQAGYALCISLGAAQRRSRV
jgi:hypothetical protein